jgi:hypothetical protein
MPRKSNIKEKRAAKLSKKIESSLSSISKIENSLVLYRMKLRVIHEKQLKAIKRTTRKERVKFMKEMTFPKGMLLSLDFNSHSVQRLDESDPPLLETNFLPLEAFDLIANYLGPIELIAFTSVSMTISHKIAVIYPQLYRNLTLSMGHSIYVSSYVVKHYSTASSDDTDDDFDVFEYVPNSTFFEGELTKCNGFVSSLSGLKIDKDDRRKCLLRSTMIRLIFRIQYFMCSLHININCTRTVSEFDKVNPKVTFIFDKKAFKNDKPPPRFSFLPLNIGTVLYTPFHSLCVSTRNVESLRKGLELKRKGAVNKEAALYMDYDDCKDLMLEPLVTGNVHIQGDEPLSLRTSQIAHFTQKGMLKNIPVRHLKELKYSWVTNDREIESYMESLRFIDYNELRFMRKIQYLNAESQIEECEKKFESFLSMLM